MGALRTQPSTLKLTNKGNPISEIDLALARLEGVKKIAGGYQAKCPCHNDQHQSLSVAEKDGKIMLFCHAGCSFESIIKALDLRPQNDNIPPQIVATYDYFDADGKLLYQVVRYHPKSFKQRRPDGSGGWIWDLKGITPTLYHLPDVLEAIKEEKLIWIVEGEKDVENLRTVGQVATTISGGASTKWAPNLIPLFFNSTIAIIPDQDEPGRKYAQYVANLLYGWCISLKVITLPLKDVTDYLETKTVDNLLNIVYNTREYIPVGAVTRDEFNELRGLNIYLLRSLMVKRNSTKRIYNKYT